MIQDSINIDYNDEIVALCREGECYTVPGILGYVRRVIGGYEEESDKLPHGADTEEITDLLAYHHNIYHYICSHLELTAVLTACASMKDYTAGKYKKG